jgi:hypothetical protein
MTRPTPLMFTVPDRSARLSDPWAQAHMELLALLLPPVPVSSVDRYTAARDFCRRMATQSPADASAWHREADHWQAQLERVSPPPEPVVAATDPDTTDDEPPF